MYEKYEAIAPISTLSAIGCLIVICLVLKHARLRNQNEARLVVVLSFFYLALNIATLFPAARNDVTDKIANDSNFCIAQGIIIYISGLGGMLWTSYIALHMYQIVYREINNFNWGIIKPFIVILIITGFGVSFPSGFEDFGEGIGTPYCWIVKGKNNHGTVFTFVLFYVEIWLSLIWIMYAYIKVTIKVKANLPTDEGARLAARLKWYSVLHLIFYIPQSISRIADSSATITDPSFYNYKLFAACWIRLLGLSNSIAYGFTIVYEETRTRVPSSDDVDINTKI